MFPCQPFTCTRQNLTIRGTAVLPAVGGRRPAVILCHGFMGRHQDMLPYAQAFAAWGYAAFAFDFCGGGLRSASDGRTTEMTVSTEKQNLLAVMDAVLARDDVDPKRLYLLGGSQGGLVTALAAAERPAQVAALMMLFPALCIPDHAKRGALMMAAYDPENPPEIIHCGPMPLGRCYHDDIVKLDPYAVMTAYAGPVLILHGTDDRVVPIAYSERAAETYGHDNCQLIPIAGADHGFTQEENHVALHCIKLFLEEQRELLRIPVQITRTETLVPGENGRVAVYFDASCDCRLFCGKTVHEGVDTQELKNGKAVKLCAVYTLDGTDCAGKPCSLSIINTNVDGQWKPRIQTASEALSFLNDADLTAVLEFLPNGPVVHIFGCSSPC